MHNIKCICFFQKFLKSFFKKKVLKISKKLQKPTDTTVRICYVCALYIRSNIIFENLNLNFLNRANN